MPTTSSANRPTDSAMRLVSAFTVRSLPPLSTIM
jgi:hypothetical protein